MTFSDGEGKHARGGARDVALSRTLDFTNQLDTVDGIFDIGVTLMSIFVS